MCDEEKDWHERSFRASGEINGCQKFPLNEPEIEFSFFISEPPVLYFKSLFDALDSKCNTFMCVVMMLK